MTTETNTDTSSEDVSGLKNKNAELIRKLKEAEKRATDAEAENEELAERASAGDELTKLQREFAKLQKTLTDVTAERDTLAGDLRTTRVDSAISAAIASGNVRPEMVEAVEAIMHRKVQYEDGEATINGASIQDFAKSYFGKDGAHFVRAADNSGADGQGNNGSKAPNHDFTKETYNHAAWASVYTSEGREVADAIAEQVGRPDVIPSD